MNAVEFAIIGGSSKVNCIVAADYCARRANLGECRSSLVSPTKPGHYALGRGLTVFDQELDQRIGGVLDERTIRSVTKALARLQKTAANAPAPIDPA